MSIGVAVTSCLTEKKMKRFPRPCIDCGVLTTNTSRCPTHEVANQTKRQLRQDSNIERRIKKARLYGASGQVSYKTKAKALRESNTHCYLCLKPKTETNRLEADHIYPSLFDQSPLLPAHRSCNNQKGNKGIDQLDPTVYPGLELALRTYPPEIYLRHIR